MKLYDLTMDVIAKYLDTKDTIAKVIEKIKIEAGGSGRFAFYPCSRYANMIVREIKRTEPELFSRIEAIFDKSEEAKSDTGVKVYKLSVLPTLKERISFMVVAHNTFCDYGVKDLRQIAGYNGKLIKTSYFDITLGSKNKDELLSSVEEIYNLLQDDKSKAVYLSAWLSRALNDHVVTSLFESEEEIAIDGKMTLYKNFKIKELGVACAQELYCEIYKMRYVYPEPGEYVFDIGAYKGDSAIFFADSVGGAGKVFAFEPTQKNFKVLVDNVASNNLSKIIVPVNKGISDKSGTMGALTFDWGAPSSFISDEEGNEQVQITTIDEFVKENSLKKLDFIKMDVEGLEYQVISGGAISIKRFTPKLAIPLYHNTSDLVDLPLLVKKIADYKFYMRYKIEGAFGITMYCIKD